MSVLSEIRRLPDQIQGLAHALKTVASSLGALVELQKENGPSDERLNQLELTRATWEAEIEALLLKAESTYKSASNAESRSRTMLRHAEKITDPFHEEGEDVPAGIPPEHVGVSPSEAVPTLHQDLGVLSPKELALRMKFS